VGAGQESVLARILAQTRATIERRKSELPIVAIEGDAALARNTTTTPGRLRAALARPGIGAIAEFKRRSPSAGELRTGADPAEIARAYERAGAAAMSVLTEEANFGGSLEDLRAARAACSLPILRKDFIVDPYQLHEARAAGADAVLLIVACLEDGQLRDLQGFAREIGLDVLVEVHDADEAARALAAGADLVGVNNRDLRDFRISLDTTFGLVPALVDGKRVVVSESGISAREHCLALESVGVDAVLVGEALMTAPDPSAALSRLRGKLAVGR
jgi:indole-3-glycerol phosphate synthase